MKKKKEIKHYFYFSAPETAGEFMRTVPIEKRDEIKVCFPIESDYSFECPTQSVCDSLMELLFKGPRKPLTESRLKEILAEIDDLISHWPELKVPEGNCL